MRDIGGVRLSSPFVAAPIAGLTDSPFRRLVKRHGGCGLVVTEMVSAEGLVRGTGRTPEYARFTGEERPIAVQIFGAVPARMAEAARVVAGLGADIVDVNMGCPVPKVAKGAAGCSLMREPARAAAVVAAMVQAVSIPVTVKMRSGWNERTINAPELARLAEEAGAAAVCVHGRTAAQSYSGRADWALIERVAGAVRIPVFGSGDCTEPEHLATRMASGKLAGIFVGRGLLRNPWIFAQASDLVEGRQPRVVTPADRAQFLRDYIELLLAEPSAEPSAARRQTSRASRPSARAGLSPDRHAIQKLRALIAWFSKGLEGGSHLRAAINRTETVSQATEALDRFFGVEPLHA
jgi:tRNA-dihydrouridine synthase B